MINRFKENSCHWKRYRMAIDFNIWPKSVAIRYLFQSQKFSLNLKIIKLFGYCAFATVHFCFLQQYIQVLPLLSYKGDPWRLKCVRFWLETNNNHCKNTSLRKIFILQLYEFLLHSCLGTLITCDCFTKLSYNGISLLFCNISFFSIKINLNLQIMKLFVSSKH